MRAENRKRMREKLDDTREDLFRGEWDASVTLRCYFCSFTGPLFQISHLLGVRTALHCRSIRTLPLWEQQYCRAQSPHAGKFFLDELLSVTGLKSNIFIFS